MRLIDADALLADLGINGPDCQKCGWYGKDKCMRGYDFQDACVAIEDTPTIDAAEVVRCKDCEDWGRSMVVHGRRVCSEWSDFENGRIRLTGGNDFCSYGERRSDDD